MNFAVYIASSSGQQWATSLTQNFRTFSEKHFGVMNILMDHFLAILSLHLLETLINDNI